MIQLDQRLTGERVAAILDRIGRERGLLEKIRVDNGSESTGRVLGQWAYLNHVRLDFSQRGKPTDNGLIEAFNGRLRAECLHENWFMSLDDARSKVEALRRYYNEERHHSALGNLAPTEFAASTGRRAWPVEARKLTLQWAQDRVQAQTLIAPGTEDGGRSVQRLLRRRMHHLTETGTDFVRVHHQRCFKPSSF